MKKLLKRIKNFLYGILDRYNGFVNGGLRCVRNDNADCEQLFSEQTYQTVKIFRKTCQRIRNAATKPTKGNQCYLSKPFGNFNQNAVNYMDNIEHLRALHPKVAHNTATKAEENEYFELLNSMGKIPDTTYEKYKSNKPDQAKEALTFAIIIAGIVILVFLAGKLVNKN